MKKKLLVGLATVTMLSMLTVQAEATIVASDIMDLAGNSWNMGVTEYQFMHGITSGIAPTAGDDTMHFNTAGVPYSGTNYITFTDTDLAVGDYVATIDVGNYNNRAWPTIGLVGMTANGILLLPTSYSTPTPASGRVLTWSYSYSIGSSDLSLGKDIGFSITVPYSTGVESNVAFDNLRIDFSPTTSPVPEPATMLLFGTGLAGLAAARRRKKAC